MQRKEASRILGNNLYSSFTFFFIIFLIIIFFIFSFALISVDQTWLRFKYFHCAFLRCIFICQKQPLRLFILWNIFTKNAIDKDSKVLGRLPKVGHQCTFLHGRNKCFEYTMREFSVYFNISNTVLKYFFKGRFFKIYRLALHGN